jgi:diguanylate cyclase (GGDEF)-like protein
MTAATDDLIAFDDEDAGTAVMPGRPWRILVVDDDPEVHQATAFALDRLTILDRPIELLHASSGNEALAILKREADIAVILLDVVMETPSAGLDIIAVIRGELGLANARIVLRTGQPGYAPEIETIRHFDINDYKTKSELTRSKLFATLSTALRAYDLLEQLRSIAYSDMLTGLLNRAGLVDRLDRCSANEDCRSKVLALIDIDQFAAVNDMFGHAYADRLLGAVGKRLQASFAECCLVARVGNDTFAVFGEDERVQPVSLRILLTEPYKFDDIEHVISVCTGIVRVADSRGSGADVLKDGWIALKHAKLGGHGQNAYFSATAGQEARERTRLLHALRHAFRLERFFLAFQPQVNLASGQVIGVEALLRWRGEDGNFIAPDRFIPIAESSGLIVDLGAWVLRNALRTADEIRQAGHPGITMAINVAAPQFAHPAFLEVLDDALAGTMTPPEMIELEITESVAIMGAESVGHLLRAVKQRRLQIAIDDFGTGYSSLAYLDRLPADRIKIDRSFVNALHAGEKGARIAEMIVPLGHQLGMRVLAEGVETEAQADRLRTLGCHEAQGYLYARPMPLSELLPWLGRQVGNAG